MTRVGERPDKSICENSEVKLSLDCWKANPVWLELNERGKERDKMSLKGPRGQIM